MTRLPVVNGIAITTQVGFLTIQACVLENSLVNFSCVCVPHTLIISLNSQSCLRGLNYPTSLPGEIHAAEVPIEVQYDAECVKPGRAGIACLQHAPLFQGDNSLLVHTYIRRAFDADQEVIV